MKSHVAAAAVALAGLLSCTQLQAQDQNLAADAEAASFAELFLAQGMLGLASGDAATALPLFDRALATQPQDATAQYFRGICLHKLARLDEAISAFKAALPPATSRVAESRIRTGLGAALLDKGDASGAEKELQPAVDANVEDAQARFLLGIARLRNNKTDEGLIEIEKAVGLDPRLDQQGNYYRGIAAWRAGKLDEAKQLLAGAEGTVSGGSMAQSSAWMAALDSAQSYAAPPKGEIRINVGYERDTNPGQLTDGSIALLDDFGGSAADERGTAQLRASWLPLRDRHGWTLDLTGQSFISRYNDQSQFDTVAYGAFVALAHGGTALGSINGPLGFVRVPRREQGCGWLLQAGADRFDLDGDKFRSVASASVSGLFNEAAIGQTQIDLQAADEQYEDVVALGAGSKALSGTVLTGQISQYFWIGPLPTRYFRASYAYVDRSAEVDDLERTDRRVTAELSWPLGSRWHLLLAGAGTRTEYDQFAGFARTDRRLDLRGTVSFAITRSLYAALRVSATHFSVKPTFFASDLDFDRHLTSLSLTWQR